MLQLLGTGAVVTAAVVAPGAIGPIIKLISKQTEVDEASARAALRYARVNGWVHVRETRDDIELVLTEQGRQRVRSLSLEQPLKRHYWDQRWRIVIFDIPAARKKARNPLRLALKQLGLAQLQKSVWITPYRCRDEITALRKLYNIAPFIQLLEVKRLENELKWRDHFGLV
ncbi:MAG TPA: hypothetical protein VK963_04660 [Candidatus Saccharimonadales bacterium]|nr:hypothetical protein [Candidatus Saccharimonadales bacterium]